MGDMHHILPASDPRGNYGLDLQVCGVSFWPDWTTMLKGVGVKKIFPKSHSAAEAERRLIDEFGPAKRLGVIAVHLGHP